MKKLLYLFSAGLLFSQLSLAQVHNLELSSYSNQLEIRATGSITLQPGFHLIPPAGQTVLISVQRFPFVSGSPTTGQNYILTRSFRSPVKASQLSETRTIDQENRTVQYFDGLGRSLQTVQQQASPGFRDIVEHVEYDGFGRQTHQYLPYADVGTSYGSYRSTAKANQLAYYGSGSLDAHVKKTTAPYAVTVFENSPLNRVKEQGAPGVAWQPATTRGTSGRTVVSDYGTNVVSTTESVKLWQINTSKNGATGTSNYVAGRLYKTVIKDENWLSGKTGTVEEYKDFEDRVVLKRVWESEAKKLDTYYVYDDLGNLRYVVPPAYTSTSIAESATGDFHELVYAYRYDGRQRLAEKKIPGKGWEWIVYNNNDQPILTQDAVQRGKASKEWRYTKYDAFGR
ncbi:RHS repeat-associated core domain-containing protein, partial [Sphingobacterium faecium]|uniref:DUF6443 domain-containing protein n=1 Tax=Sphingobacterium faecium TaxID=34087 RepID=UPI0013602893